MENGVAAGLLFVKFKVTFSASESNKTTQI